MQFDWTTFALEIINFLVLLWLLKRFLYKPVLNMLDARQKRVRDQLAKAEATHAEAEKLKSEYDSRLDEWQRDQMTQRQILKQELAEDREKQHAALKQTLQDERAKAQAREKAAAELEKVNLTKAIRERAYRASTAMLKRLATSTLTARIVEVLIEDLHRLSEERQQMLRDAVQDVPAETPVNVAVVSAHDLTPESAHAMEVALADAIQHPVRLTFSTQPDVIAGVRLTMREYVLHANLADDLAFFEEHDPHA